MLISKNGSYYMHIYIGNAKPLPLWEEFGREVPAPKLTRLGVGLKSCAFEEFAQKVSSQYVIVTYGDYTESLNEFCSIPGIEVI